MYDSAIGKSKRGPSAAHPGASRENNDAGRFAQDDDVERVGGVRGYEDFLVN